MDCQIKPEYFTSISPTLMQIGRKGKTGAKHILSFSLFFLSFFNPSTMTNACIMVCGEIVFEMEMEEAFADLTNLWLDWEGTADTGTARFFLSGVSCNLQAQPASQFSWDYYTLFCCKKPCSITWYKVTFVLQYMFCKYPCPTILVINVKSLCWLTVWYEMPLINNSAFLVIMMCLIFHGGMFYDFRGNEPLYMKFL